VNALKNTENALTQKLYNLRQHNRTRTWQNARKHKLLGIFCFEKQADFSLSLHFVRFKGYFRQEIHRTYCRMAHNWQL